MIERLSLRNFKSIQGDKFDLENLTLLTGLNGAGKSSILQSMLLLRQSFEKHLLPNTGISLRGDYINIGTGKDLLFADAENEIIEIQLDWGGSSIDLKFQYQENSDMLPVEKLGPNINGAPFEEALFKPGFQYLSADRISPKSTYDVSEYAVIQQRTLGNRGEFTAHFLAENGNKEISIKALKHKKAKSKTLIESLNYWMSEITPGTNVIAKLIPEINKVSLHYKFSLLTEFTPLFRPENTGFGLTYVLPIVTAVLSSHPGDLLFIENPESHLHPAGQSLTAKLISLAAMNGVQIVIETHSDHFLNGVRKSVKLGDIDSDKVAIYFLSRDSHDIKHDLLVDKVRVNPNGSIENWPSGFFDEWEKSLNALIIED